MATRWCSYDPNEICYKGCNCRVLSCDESCSCLERFGRNYHSVKTEKGSRVRTLKAVDMHVRGDPTPPIFECNSMCKCGQDCENRLVQNGVSVNLRIFSCGDQRGFGLRTLEPLERGRFVCEYAGEVLNLEEARRRALAQSSSDNNYIIGVREHTADDIQVTFIDPEHIGNVGRFINHSCDPNLIMIPVRVDSLVVRLGLFAMSRIEAGEELTFNYGGNLRENRQLGDKTCLCRAINCSGYLPFDVSLF